MQRVVLLCSLLCVAAGLKCWEDGNLNGYKHTSSKTKQSCDDGCDYCAKTYVSVANVESATWGCGCGGTAAGIQKCTEKGKFDISSGNSKIELNCCKGNLCNAASGGTSMLASALSALGLVLLR